MLRRLFTVLSAASLAMCVAAVVLLVRGIRVVDVWYQDTPWGHVGRVTVGAGHVGVMWPDGWDGPPVAWAHETLDARAVRRGRVNRGTFGLVADRLAMPDGTRCAAAAVPMWAVLLATSAPPAVWSVRRLRQRPPRHAGAVR